LSDAGFFAANFAKVAEGGYVPLILAALVYGVMLIWHLGANAVSARLQDAVVPLDTFMAKIVEGSIPRVPGTAVFLTRTQRDVPPVMAWHVKHNRALHEKRDAANDENLVLSTLVPGGLEERRCAISQLWIEAYR
jgi:KUP system potassium uptake protein